MECLSGLVGIRGICTPDAPNSIFYINDLPNISVDEIDASINSESNSAISEITNKITLAGDLIAQRIRSHFNPRFKGDSIIQNGVIGFAKDNLEVIATQTGYLIGKQIQIKSNGYLELFISSIGLHLPTSGTTNVFVYDLIQNKLLDTIPVATIADEISSVSVYKSYKTLGQDLNLFICYAYVSSYKTILSRNNCTSCTGHVYSNPYARFSNQSLLSSDTKIQDNLVGSSENGITFTYSVNCSFDPFICSSRHLLAEAIWWKAGELLVMELLNSKRNNSIVNLYGVEHQAAMEAYSAAANASLVSLLQNMRLPDNECFSCNKRVKLEVSI